MTFKEYLLLLIYNIPQLLYWVSLLILCLASIVFLRIYDVRKAQRLILVTFLFGYVFLLYCSTVIFRTSQKEWSYNLIPFWSYERKDLYFENIMNVVVFVPVGLLLCVISRRLKWWMVLFIGMVFSLSIELLQFIFKRGCTEFDDVFHNSLGCVIGIMIVAIIKGIWLLQKRYLTS